MVENSSEEKNPFIMLDIDFWISLHTKKMPCLHYLATNFVIQIFSLLFTIIIITISSELFINDGHKDWLHIKGSTQDLGELSRHFNLLAIKVVTNYKNLQSDEI